MTKWLNPEQRDRLAEVVNEALRTSKWKDLGKELGCSQGFLSGIHSGNGKGVSLYFALYICRGLNVNPYYVTDGIEPKYRSWSVAFFADRK